MLNKVIHLPKYFDTSEALFSSIPDMRCKSYSSKLSKTDSDFTLGFFMRSHSCCVAALVVKSASCETKMLHQYRSCHSWEKQPVSGLSQHALYCMAMQETPHGNFGIFPIVPKGKGGFHMEVGNARKWQAFFVDYLKINLWVLTSLSTAKQKTRNKKRGLWS